MSDTHSLTPYIKFDVPAGDVFIHAGDFTKCGRLQEVVEFNNWIGKLSRVLYTMYAVLSTRDVSCVISRQLATQAQNSYSWKP